MAKKQSLIATISAYFSTRRKIHGIERKALKALKRAPTEPPVKCSFCGKGSAKLIEGEDGARICPQCIATIAGMLQGEK